MDTAINISREVQKLEGHEGSVFNVKFNSNGEYCLSCGEDKKVLLWNPHNGILVNTYEGHNWEVLDICCSKENTQIASCGADKQAILWDVLTGAQIRKIRGHNSRITCVSFNSSSSLLFTGSYDKTVKIWDLRARSFVPVQILEDAKDSVESIWVSEFEIITSSVDQKIRNYDLRAGKLRVDMMPKPTTFTRLSNDRNCLLTSVLDGSVKLLDKENGELLNEYRGHDSKDYKVKCEVAFDDSVVFSGSEDGLVYCWDLVEGKLLARLKGHSKVVSGLSYHPKEHCLLSCSVDGTVRVWK